MRKENRVGERKIMNCGEECEIIEYRKAVDITVKFIKTNELIKSTYNNFKKGEIKSHFTPSVYSAGIIGLEKTLDGEGKHLKSYEIWHNMLQRCYDERYKEKHPTYKECTVCDEWKFYKNFKDWYEENYYEMDNQHMTLDKDILAKENKIYSPETCVFVPQNINSLFTKSDAKRGEYPIGVDWHKANQVYQTRCRVFNVKTLKNNSKYLGCYNTPQEAFNAYKKTKEENIKQVADYYKDRIPSKLYDAMYKYEVHIDD
ncbi:MAG: hypothetical protein E6182_18340 [Clostridioides difficile]|nr:hypothetical protein [Clostridioides difficile]